MMSARKWIGWGLVALGWASRAAIVHADGWMKNVDQALQVAAQQQRPVVVYVSMDGCHYCKKMAQTTLVDQQVQQTLGQAFVPVAIKGADYPDMMRALKIRSFPTTLLATSDGQIVDQLTGYTDVAKFQQHLQAAWQRQQQLQAAPAESTQPPAPVQNGPVARRGGNPTIRR